MLNDRDLRLQFALWISAWAGSDGYGMASSGKLHVAPPTLIMEASTFFIHDLLLVSVHPTKLSSNNANMTIHLDLSTTLLFECYCDPFIYDDQVYRRFIAGSTHVSRIIN